MLLPDNLLKVLDHYSVEYSNWIPSYVIKENGFSITWTKLLPHCNKDFGSDNGCAQSNVPGTAIISTPSNNQRRKHKSPSQIRHEKKRRKQWLLDRKRRDLGTKVIKANTKQVCVDTNQTDVVVHSAPDDAPETVGSTSDSKCNIQHKDTSRPVLEYLGDLCTDTSSGYRPDRVKTGLCGQSFSGQSFASKDAPYTSSGLNTSETVNGMCNTKPSTEYAVCSVTEVTPRVVDVRYVSNSEQFNSMSINSKDLFAYLTGQRKDLPAHVK